MARIAGVNVPTNKRVEIGLTYIFGVGRSTANELLKKAGVDPNTKVSDLTEDEVSKLDGHKSLYSTSFYAEDEFYQLYNGEAYRALKRAYDGEGRLLGLYEKCVTGR